MRDVWPERKRERERRLEVPDKDSRRTTSSRDNSKVGYSVVFFLFFWPEPTIRDAWHVGRCLLSDESPTYPNEESSRQPLQISPCGGRG